MSFLWLPRRLATRGGSALLGSSAWQLRSGYAIGSMPVGGIIVGDYDPSYLLGVVGILLSNGNPVTSADMAKTQRRYSIYTKGCPFTLPEQRHCSQAIPFMAIPAMR